MPRWTKTVQANFTHGEYSPQVWGRIDTKLYSSGLRHGLNAALLPQGGIRLRPGTIDYSDVLADSKTRIWGMFYNTDEEYLIVFQAGQFWIFDAAQDAGTVIAHFSGLPWAEADMDRLYFMSIQGTMVVTHEKFWPIRIMRHDVHVLAWDVFPFEFSPDGAYCYMPYYKFAAAPITLTPSAVGPGNITLTSNGPFWSTFHPLLTAQGKHVHFTITYPADPVAGTTTVTFTLLIIAVADNLHATATLLGTKPLPNLQPQVQWREQITSPVWGYPRCVGFHDQRLIFAGHPYAPGYFTASQTGAPYNFDIGTGQDDEAISAVITTESSNQIRSVLSGHHLTIMTSQGPFYFPGSETAPITPSTITFRRTAAAECSWTAAVFYDQATQYVQRKGGHVRELMYDLYKQAYTADATSLLSAHLLNEPVQLAVMAPDGAGNQNQYMLALNQDGTIAWYLGDRNQEVSGWLPWNTAGTVRAVGSVGEFSFMAVRRFRNGVYATILERIRWDYPLDCAETYTSATAKTVWTGLTQWNNTQVTVIGDGYWMGTYTISATGVLTLPSTYPCKSILVGFVYGINWETMAIDQMLTDGPKQGRPYSLASTVLRLTNTEAIRINGKRLWMRVPKDPTGVPPPLFTGVRELFLRGWKTDYTVVMTLDYPCSVEVDGFNIEMNI